MMSMVNNHAQLGMKNIKDIYPDDESKEKLINRLSRLEGQIRGVKRLIQEDNDCEKVLQQMSASRKAMDKAFIAMITCLLEASFEEESNSKERIKFINSLLNKYG